MIYEINVIFDRTETDIPEILEDETYEEYDARLKGLESYWSSFNLLEVENILSNLADKYTKNDMLGLLESIIELMKSKRRQDTHMVMVTCRDMTNGVIFEQVRFMGAYSDFAKLYHMVKADKTIEDLDN